MRNPLRKLRYWPNELFEEILWAIFYIVLGLVLITTIQLVVFPYVFVPIGKAVSFPNLQIQSADWNTVRAIWFAEVPLAYLLRRILGGARAELTETQQRDFENTNLALDKRGMKDLHEYLKGFCLVDKRGELVTEDAKREIWGLTGRWPIQVVANLKTRKLFRMQSGIALLAYNSVFDCDRSCIGTSYEDLVAYAKKATHEDGKKDIEFEPRDAVLSDLERSRL